MSGTNLESQFKALRVGYHLERFPSLATRLDRLRRVKAMLSEHEAAWCEALSQDFGYRSADQSSFADITTTIKAANHALKNLKFWMKAERRTPDLSLRMSGAKTYVESFPKGVVGIVSPWNFPINLALSPLISVLAAGNRAFIKPSEITPATSALLQKLIAQYFADDEVSVACGDVDVAQAFVKLPFDHIIYTGGETVAKYIMRDAAENLVPLTLELGGKSPVIVSSSADLKLTAKRVAFGKYFNAGQICIAPDYLLIAPERLDAFLIQLKAAVENADSSQGSTDSVSIVNDRHRQRLDNLVAEGEGKGGKVVRFSGLNQSAYQLTVVIDPSNDAAINTGEIFGPVLLIKTIGDLSEQISYINQSSHPLVIYYFGSSEAEFRRVACETSSGGLVKNDVIFQYANDDLPFGGVGGSGMGKYRGEYGFKEFSNSRAVYKSGFMDVSGFVTPPYSDVFRMVNKLMRKI
ncbi:aldehyde dehydrogenase family protein [Zhongshania sp.]|uniref:aldehyde dehydrogenase family protein n=1 Tax=Zhongshania sp. TaxID=1971902 RepID=UPI001B7C03CC|nr:aldehyde dehydrogenase family protein [Zhongshania sp.]MBQ0795176.1 aldehyde dehydrogenase family protein [Zhongshania sp.]